MGKFKVRGDAANTYKKSGDNQNCDRSKTIGRFHIYVNRKSLIGNRQSNKRNTSFRDVMSIDIFNVFCYN